MKFLTKIVLVIFILFQFSSVIACVINEKNGNKITYAMSDEEEHSKGPKELKSDFIVTDYKLVTPFVETPSTEIQDTYLLKHYIASSSIFLLPPEQV